ncbi:MAG: sarcosine oxidase subunit alpha family protein [Hyphomicrobiaceae bacterium]
MVGLHRTNGGGRIDRKAPLSFTFDGRSYQGVAGDTLASALLANGVHLIGRSYKYHRPRGILSAGAEEPNALVTINRGSGRITPNLRATQVELYDGLAAESQNRWPSLAYDFGAVNSLFSPLLAAGFYYKTFMGPRLFGSNRAWREIYEPLIRRAAGLGKAPLQPDPDRYANRFVHCDVLVVGAGPAGLAAALAAAEAGARVILCDEQAELGGALLSEWAVEIDGVPAATWLTEAVRTLASAPRVTLLPRTQAFGYFAQNFIGLAQRLTDHLAEPGREAPRERLWQVRAKEVVLATGAIERPIVFPDNDRPGIMLADAARTYVNRYGVRPGWRAVVLAACTSGYAAALDLKRAGIEVAMVVDPRPDASGAMSDAVRAAGIELELGATVIATGGRQRVTAVQIGRIGPEGRVTSGSWVPCDHVAMAGGWTPSVHLFSQSRGKVAWDETAQAFLPAAGAPGQAQRSAGACRGVFGIAAALEDGFAAGAAAVGREARGRTFTVRNDLTAFRGIVGTASRGIRESKAFVDFQHDVTVRDLKLAVREGFRAIEHVKRYTTTGMATDQGKTSNLNALAIVADHLDKPIPAVGLTTFRQPYTPVSFGTIAGTSRGNLFDPVRRTPCDGWAQAAGAVFEDVGAWKRARYFPRGSEDMAAAVARECRTVRSTVGMFDASTLGKIEVVGPDAAAFLDRIYVNSFEKLGVGWCRYGVLLNEAGFIIDDGVIGRLAPDRFHVTTTTGGAARVLHMMEDYAQTEFPDLKVWLTSTTEQWAVIAVQGPRARDVLAPLVDGPELDAVAFPHMSLRTARVCGVEARIFRVSFTGELGFEINVPADFGADVWEAAWREVRKHDGCAYGTETMHVLRAEKGFIIVGQETDGTVTPDDVGLGWAIGRSKRDFVGLRSLSRPDMVRGGRKQLVGLLTADPKVVLEEGAQVTEEARPPAGTPALGHVSSAYWSAALGRSIALALVADGRARIGTKLNVPMPGGDVAVEVVAPVFLDPKGERLHG